MLRTKIQDELKSALQTQNKIKASTIRLIMAAMKDRDIEARGKGENNGIGEQEILQLLQTMMKQRRESITFYRQGGRNELAAQEEEEIAVIESFLPQQLSEQELNETIQSLVQESGAASIKDMGKVMGLLKERFAGQFDPQRAAGAIKAALGA